MAAVARHDSRIIHPEGRKLLLQLTVVLVALVLWGKGAKRLRRVMPLWLALYSLLAQFFRDPGCSTPLDPDLVVSPAYGRIVHIGNEVEGEVLHDARLRVSIFLSLFDPHLTRSPIGGLVTYQRYHPGRYLVALNPKSSILNERSSLLIESEDRRILVRQIAGFVARRICTYVTKGSALSAGDEIGFIKLGSRVDLFLPEDCDLLVVPGQHVRAGETPIARFASAKG
jgi:phosphatidylserine decarboxylase